MEQINYDGHENWILYMGLGQAKYSINSVEDKNKRKAFESSRNSITSHPKVNFDKNFFTLFSYHLFWKSSTEFFE